MRTVFILIALVIGLAPATAQVSIGPEVGVNGSAYITIKDGSNTLNSLAGGVRAGAKADIGITRHWWLQPAALYVSNGYRPPLMSGGSATSLNIHTIQVPLYLIYKINAGRVTTPFFGIGPYIGLNAGGKAVVSGAVTYPFPSDPDYTRPLKIGSSETDDIKLMDAGMSLTAGLELPNGLYTSLLYQRGFANLQPQGNASNAMKQFNFGISLGYFFDWSKVGEKKK